MAKYIIHKDGAYNFYTTVADGPCYESALTLEQLTQIVKEEQGNEGLRELPARLERAHKTGCSVPGQTLEDCIVCNRAGEDEAELTLDEFTAKYLTLSSS